MERIGRTLLYFFTEILRRRDGGGLTEKEDKEKIKPKKNKNQQIKEEKTPETNEILATKEIKEKNVGTQKPQNVLVGESTESSRSWTEVVNPRKKFEDQTEIQPQNNHNDSKNKKKVVSVGKENQQPLRDSTQMHD